MKIRVLSILAIGFFLAQTLGAQMKNIEFTQYQLDNGLDVILHEDHSTPIVAVSIMYHVGSKNEKPNRTGFAHFFEHLLFEGSKNIERGEFDKYVENAGGVLNANTTQDRTYYFEILPSNQLELGLWLESERLLHANVQKVGIETQREVVKEERRQRVDNQPYGTIMENIFKRAFTQHPYTWSVIGSMDHLNAASEEDYQNFYKMFYVPNNATLSIAGDINIEETKALVEKYFGPIPRGTMKIRRPDVEEPALNGEIRDTIYDNIQLPAVIQAYRMPANGTDDYYAMDMVSKVLSGGPSSRMATEIVDDQELALAVNNFAYGLEDEGLSIFFGIANLGIDPQTLENSMDEVVDGLQSELISEKEFQKLQNQIEADFVSSNSSMRGIAGSLATYHTLLGDANLINEEIDRYQDVTREEIQAAAQKYLQKDNRVVLHYLPKQEANQ